MKRTFFLVLFLFIFISLFAGEDLFEGYADFKWGATVEEVKTKFPTMQEDTSDDDKKAGKSVYFYEGENFSRVFRFCNGKLYWGRTIYKNPDATTLSAIVRKMISIYGKPNSNDERNNNKYKSIFYRWEMTPTFEVEFDLRSFYDDYGQISVVAIFLTYQNLELYRIIQENLTNGMIEDLQL